MPRICRARPSGSRTTALADFDGDRKNDIALVSSYGADVFWSRGAARFERGFSAFLTYGTDVAAGTVDCDAVPDLISLSGGEGVAVFAGSPAGLPAAASGRSSEPTHAAAGMRAGDFDGNGQLDVAQPAMRSARRRAIARSSSWC